MKQMIEKIYPKIVGIRRYLHQHPELSYHEEQTAALVTKHLTELGLEVKTRVGGLHGVTGFLRGSKPGPTVALRADMDALPIEDAKNSVYRSTVPGVMHACGHDGHTATLLGVAEILSEMRDEIEGQVLFIFQPAEEVPPGGAFAMVQEGVVDQVAGIFALHLWATSPTGTIGTRSGELMAAADNFTIEIQGKGGHAGIPHQCVDPIVIASHLVIQLQSIVSRQIDPQKAAVISVCKIEAGDSHNVIPDSCLILGTVRTFDMAVRDSIVEKLDHMCQGIGKSFGAECKLTYVNGYPAVVNHPEATELVRSIALDVVGQQGLVETEPIAPGEDFSYFLQKVPGAFCFVGCGNPEQYFGSHHHPHFDIDEESMKIGMELLANLALRFLDKESSRAELAECME
ncbi:amidohydrolase [Thermoactinomyces sp. DSM 45891]|uniref:M20 metallopeptidase family protein n=1 Tax=Thermoactinomyces sp. DSM 45891 TaxID=1761907 RepID=UPI00091DEA0E|nr:M20 family metallopeptidase [Thermoactinomyces sp. DSM 45891]SFX45111.1 amidohydrolase [Thermoactinomyces sp. DSM 45891]